MHFSGLFHLLQECSTAQVDSAATAVPRSFQCTLLRSVRRKRWSRTQLRTKISPGPSRGPWRSDSAWSTGPDGLQALARSALAALWTWLSRTEGPRSAGASIRQQSRGLGRRLQSLRWNSKHARRSGNSKLLAAPARVGAGRCRYHRIDSFRQGGERAAEVVWFRRVGSVPLCPRPCLAVMGGSFTSGFGTG